MSKKTREPAIGAVANVADAMQTEPIIQPIIRVVGQKHALEQLWEEDEAPELRAVGYKKIYKDRQHSWVSYVITTRGDQVTKIEISEPDMRPIAEEASKASFVTSFMDDSL